jgi:Xaa-Pro aminopeptidase
MAILKPDYMQGARGAMAVDWERRIDMAGMREQRRRRAQEAIVAAGYDAVVLLSDPNIRYVTAVATTSVSGAGGFHYSLLSGDGQITHWDSADHAVHERLTCPWLTDIRYAAPGIGIVPAALGAGAAADALGELMAGELARALASHGVRPGVGAGAPRVGLDVAQPSLAARLERHGYSVDAGAGAPLAAARARKSEDEVECLRLSAAVCEAGFQAMREAIKPGARESEVFAAGVARIIELGGEHGGGNISSGPNTWPKSQADTTDRIIRPGDVVYSDLYNIGFHGYRSCYYRTFSCGPPLPATCDAHKRAVQNLYAVLDAIEPGATTAQAAARFPDAAGEYWDYYGAEHAWQMTTNHWGHGIGLSLYEIPLTWRGASPPDETVYETGMTMAVETQDRDGAGQGVRVEEMVVVREGGVELLTRWPIEEITVCG